MNIENIIREKERGEFYDYYVNLGYDHKTAASLALFTYGSYRYNDFSMNDLYDSLCRGEEYLPREENHWFNQNETSDSDEPTDSGHENHGCSNKMMSLDSDVSVDDELEDTDICLSERAKEFYNGLYYRRESIGESSVTNNEIDIFDQLGNIGFATDEYEPIEEKAARKTSIEPSSTFRMTNNTASAGIVLNQLRHNRRIDKSMVRIEELLNYFRYESNYPENGMFNISTELMDADSERKYLYVNVQGREEIKERQNITILLDISGSMSLNVSETQAIIATIISKLGNGDKVSLVTYSNNDHIELDSVAVNGPEDRIHILEKLLSIEIAGYTNGSRGIEQAYNIGKKNYINGGNNQVILITDGDLNFGITDKGGLEELIKRRKKDNLFLSVIGIGLYNYKDDKMEVLSKYGNGVYRVVNNLSDIKKSIDEDYTSLVNIIARDVKAQMEFNPEIVESYRLLGFENRALSHEDFTNDKVISEPFGSGGYGVALYELIMKKDPSSVVGEFKYSRIITTGSRDLGTIKVRYKEPLRDVSHELEKVIGSSEASYTDNLRLAFIIFVCGEKLRRSDKIGVEEIDLAKKLYQELGESIKERNSSDLYMLAEILEKSEEDPDQCSPDELYLLNFLFDEISL